MYYPVGHYQVQYGSTLIEYELIYSQRKTLAIHVYPDASILVDAPLDSPVELVAQKVKKRGGWILRQIKTLETAPPPPYTKQYVSGETYRYLGRQYQLKVMENTSTSVRLLAGYIHVYVDDKTNREKIKTLLENWYQNQARFVFKERLDICFPRVQHLNVGYPELSIRDMRLRWGSCSPNGVISLNIKLIQVPKPYIDYVILHELCHLEEPNHSFAFYSLLDRILPNWRTIRSQLNEFELEL